MNSKKLKKTIAITKFLFSMFALLLMTSTIVYAEESSSKKERKENYLYNINDKDLYSKAILEFNKENEPANLERKNQKITLDENNFYPQSISGELVLNNGFELGHVYWEEISDYDIIYNDAANSFNGSWYAWLYPDEMLISNIFSLPSNLTSLTINYNASFTHSGVCATGDNIMSAALYDETLDEVADLLSVHDVNTDESDEGTYYNYNANSTADLSGRTGHSMKIIFWGLNEDPSNCELELDLDDVSLTATVSSSPSTFVHRFWSNSKQGHFFTINEAEKDFIIANDSSWSYEGIAYNSFTFQELNATPIHRFWSNSKQHHFFTVSEAEKDFIIANDSSWSYEGIAYYAYANQQNDSIPVYRFWSQQKQGHFFTINETEKDFIIANDASWNYEGIAWYVPTN